MAGSNTAPLDLTRGLWFGRPRRSRRPDSRRQDDGRQSGGTSPPLGGIKSARINGSRHDLRWLMIQAGEDVDTTTKRDKKKSRSSSVNVPPSWLVAFTA